MKKHFNTIGLISRQRRDSSTEQVLMNLMQYLADWGRKIILEKETAVFLQGNTAPLYAMDEIGQHCDLIIVVGGDGSLLQAAKAAIPFDKPILGINRGYLGFLADIHPDEISTRLIDILEGKYQEEQRFLLEAVILPSPASGRGAGVPISSTASGREAGVPISSPASRRGAGVPTPSPASGRGAGERVSETPQSQLTALNDVVLLPGKIAHLIEFEVFINDQFVCHHRADGLIVATPTGSTAYALSGGGPILHPSLDAIVLVPMFPHTLSSRPIVVSGDSQVVIKMSQNTPLYPRLSCDGQPSIELQTDDVIKIQKQPQKLRLIHPVDYDYFDTLRVKLHWERK